MIKIAFRYEHKNVRKFKVIESKKLNNVANKYHNRVKQAMPYSTMTYDAAYLKYSYAENGEEFEEIMFTLIENWGQLGAGMWGNKETFLVRAPLNELSKWEGVFSVIQNSVKLNLKWLIGEIRGQATRGEIALNTQKEIEKIGREITQHK